MPPNQYYYVLIKVDRQQQITKAVIRAQENERMHIGRELHDNVNQMLACVKHYLNHSLAHDEDRVAVIRKSITTLDNCIDEIRGLSRSLIPPSLGDLGLKQAVKELCAALSLGTLSIRIYGLHSIKEQRLCDELKLSVYRILQEQLNNVLKHSQASRVTLRFKQTADQLYLQVADNGCGFDIEATRKGIGLLNIHNRAAAYNGNVDISSAKGKGVALTVLFSLHAG